jgi:transposase
MSKTNITALSVETRQQLVKLEKSVLNKYASLKIKIVLALDKSKWTQKDLAEIFGLDEDTITKIKQDFINCNGDFESWIDTDYKGGNGTKLTSEQEQEVSRYVENNMIASSAIIQDHIFTAYQVFYSISGLVKLLHRLGFSYKKPILVPDKLNPQLQDQWLQEYWQLEQQAQESGDVILFGDACHPTHNTITHGCWQKVGKNNTKEIKAKSGRDRINIMGAYGLYNQQAILEQYDTTINADSILDFTKKVQDQYKNQSINNIHLILDNARVHHANIVQDWLRSEENQNANQNNLPRIIFKFLPAYSPNLNKIEPFWKYLKKQIANKFYSTFQEFKDAINNFISTLHSHKPQLAKFITNKFHLFQGG